MSRIPVLIKANIWDEAKKKSKFRTRDNLRVLIKQNFGEFREIGARKVHIAGNLRAMMKGYWLLGTSSKFQGVNRLTTVPGPEPDVQRVKSRVKGEAALNTRHLRTKILSEWRPVVIVYTSAE